MIPLIAVKAVAAAVLLSALTGAYFGWRGVQRDIGAQQQRVVDQKATDGLKRDAALRLDDALKAKAAAERTLAGLKDAQEVQDAKNAKTVAGLTGRIAALTRRTAGRLRDPYAKPVSGCGGGGGSPETAAAAAASDSAEHLTPTAGVLSGELTEFLQRQASEADTVNLAYIACRADAYSVRSALHQ